MEDKMYDVSQIVIDFKNAILDRQNIDYANMFLEVLKTADLNLQPIVLPAGPDDVNFPRAILNSGDGKFNATLTGKQLVVRYSENIAIATHIDAPEKSGVKKIVEYAELMLTKLVQEEVIPDSPIAKYQYQAIGYYVPLLDTSRKDSKTIEEISQTFMAQPQDVVSFGQYYETSVPDTSLVRMYQVITAKNNATDVPVLQLTISYSEKSDHGMAVRAFGKQVKELDLLSEMSRELDEISER